MADLLAIAVVLVVLALLAAAVTVVRAPRTGTAAWRADAEPTADGGTRVLLRRGDEVVAFRTLSPDADDAAVQDAIVAAEVRADTLNTRAAVR